MDSSNKHHHSGHKTSKRRERGAKYPDGYVEDYSRKTKKPHRSDKSQPEKPHASSHMGSLILAGQDNYVLSADNSYVVRFTTGMNEGEGIIINDLGNVISFLEAGSYRFEMCGQAIAYSETDVELVYYSDMFTADMEPFTKFKIPRTENKLSLTGLPTILPINRGQKVNVKLIPEAQDSIVLLSGYRLLIYKVA